MLLCVTANHRNAGFDLLNRLSGAATDAAANIVRESPFVRGAVVLATCNRFEAYLDAADTLPAPEATVDAVAVATDLEAADLRGAVAVLEGGDAARHLFAVSSGLESVVLGEDEIAGQVRRALAHARKTGTTSSALEQLFQQATRTSRGVKAATSVGGAGRSMVRLALDLAATRLTDWSTTPVLVIGTGRHAATAIAALRDRGAHSVRVASSSGRAPAFATRHGVAAAHDLRAAVSEAAVIVTCTTGVALRADDIPATGRRVVIDLGLPRNVDPGVAAMPGVELLDLELLRLHAPVDQVPDTGTAHEIVREAAARFVAECGIEPAIVALREHILGVLEDEIERSRSRGEGPETERALRHLTSVLLHGPSVRARELASEGRGREFEAALDAMFGLRTA